MALSHADQVVSWQQNENITSEEMPPQWMWPFPEELDVWFQQVIEARASASNGGGARDTPAPGGYAENQLAKDWLAKAH